MGGACCASRDRDDFLMQLAGPRETDDVWVGVCNIRGTRMLAKRDLVPGELIFEDSPMALLSSRREPLWLAEARRDLEAIDADRAWHFCLAAHCLTAADLPLLRPIGLRGLSGEAGAKVMELTEDSAALNEASSNLAAITARHIMRAAEELSGGGTISESEGLARRLDEIAARISTRGFRIPEKLTTPPSTLSALFYLSSFVNSCSAGSHTATWEFDHKKQTLKVRAVRMVVTGGEVTFDSASRPWIGSRIKSGGNCACTACRSSRSTRKKALATEGVGVASDAHFSSGLKDSDSDAKWSTSEGSCDTTTASAGDGEGPGVPSTVVRDRGAGCIAEGQKGPSRRR